MNYPIPDNILADGLSYNRDWLDSLQFLKKYVCKSLNDFWEHDGDMFCELTSDELKRAKETKLILDCSWISFGIEKLYEIIHNDCIKYEVPELNVILLTANLNKEYENYTNWFNRNLYKNKIKTYPFPVFIQMAQSINSSVVVSKIKYDKFATFSRFPREYRNVMNYELVSRQLPVDLSQSKIDDITMQEQCKKYKIDYTHNVLNKDFVMDRKDFTNHSQAIKWTESSSNFLSEYKFILVQDTSIDDFGFYITEKVWKSMLYERPIIIWGQPGVNHYLKEMGFKLYDKYFDLQFDIEKDHSVRLQLLLKEITSACERMKQNNWIELDVDTLRYNKEYLLSKKSLYKWIEPLKFI